ncbi:retrovirus-related pol polyprotein from transposon TNT 1-94 [Tanacetum coccineum]
MSTSKTYQQSLADASSETRPPMLERGSYIPWASRFRRYINRKRENRNWLNKALDEGPYQFEMFIPNNSTVPKLQTAEDLQGDALLHYDAEMELMNLILLSIPNDIYNSVDACTSAKDMWKRVERLMRGTIQNKVDRETRFTNKFDQFVVEPGEALVSVYKRFARYERLERNDMQFYNLDTFDDLFDYFSKFENWLLFKSKGSLKKFSCPLALVAHTGSSSRNTSSYYVTHPTSVVDYEDEYQQDDVHTNSEDPLASAMLNQAIIQGDRVNIQSRNSGNAGRNNRRAYVQEEIVEGSNAPNETGNVQRTLRTSSSGNTSTVQCYNCSGKGHYARNCPKPRVRDSKYFMEQMLLAKQDEAGVILTDEQNDFLFADASRMEEIEELSANICLMARIQPADNTSDAGPSYDSAFISEVQSSSNTENEEQMYPTHTKIINSTIGDDQIDSDIIFDSPNGNVNSGSIEKDTHVPDLCALEQLARNAYQEAEKQQIFAQKVQKQNTTLTSQLELYKERVRVLENINGDNNYLNEFLEADKRAKHFSQQAQSQFVRDRDIIRDLEKQRDKLDLDVKDYKRKNEELQKTHSILKRQMSENEDRYHDTVLDLEAKLKKNVDLILKLGNSLQGMFMLGPKPLSVYDQQLKHGLGYPNPYTLKQVISQCPKLYLASSLGNSEISLNVKDTEDTLDDAFKSQQKVYEKMNDPIVVANKQNCWSIDYTQINALYKDFVPQKELSAKQKYFPSSFIPSNKNSNATPSISASMPKQEMKDVFESTESELCKLEKQNYILKDQLLEVSLKHEVELSVLLNHECVDKSLHAEIEQLKKKFIEIQEDELIAHVFEKTYAYGAIRAENQNLLFTISELKTRLANVEKGMNAASSVRRPMNRDSSVTNSVLVNSKKAAKNVSVYTRFSEKKTQSKTLDTTFVVSKSKIDVESASKAKDRVFIQIILWVVDSGCSKHMTGDRSLLRNFIKKFMGTVRFGNDNFAAITGYGNYIRGNITICHVYYVGGLGHNLFSVGQFWDGDLEVAFRSNTCYIRNLEGDDLLTGGRDSNLYSISISDMATSSPLCLMSKATSTKSWLWHRRLSHLNFGTINDLTRLDLVDGLPKFKYGKDHLCSAYERGKGKKASHPPKLVPSDHTKLELLHMDLCSPMRVGSINRKKYILVIMDDFSRYMWVYFLRTKDETPEIIKKFITQAQLNYKSKVCKIRTNNGTEFKNATLKAYYEKLGIMQQFSVAQTPQRNGVVERRNRTLVEAECTMLIFSKLPEFLWAEAVATTCFTQNRSIIHTRYNKTPYDLLHGQKPNIAYFYMFGSLCYPTNDRDDLGKMKPKADIGVFIGYSETSTAEPMNTPSKEDLDNLFSPMFEEYYEQKYSDTHIYSAAQPSQVPEDSPSTSSIIVDTHEAPPIVTTSDEQTSPISLTEADEFNQEDTADFDGNA